MNYENLLRDNGLKVTPQRLGILSLMEQKGHINVDDLYVEVRELFPSVSLATMYKNINSMVVSNVITEVKVPQKKAMFEIVKKPHGHLFCQKCGEFMDISLDIENILEDAKSKSSYKLMETSLVLSGLCPDCQK
jgi:Fe2+ or Zn2+ uptake regulation protein